MLGESFFIYKLAQQVGSYFVGDYEKALIKERNDECGINNTIHRLKDVQAINVNTTFAEPHCLQVQFEPRDVLHKVFGNSPVFLTPQEMKYIDGLTDWKGDKTAGVLKFIFLQQDLRSQICT